VRRVRLVEKAIGRITAPIGRGTTDEGSGSGWYKRIVQRQRCMAFIVVLVLNWIRCCCSIASGLNGVRDDGADQAGRESTPRTAEAPVIEYTEGDKPDCRHAVRSARRRSADSENAVMNIAQRLA